MGNLKIETLSSINKIEKLYHLIKFNKKKNSAFFDNDKIDIDDFVEIVSNSDFYIVTYKGMLVGYFYLEFNTTTYATISWGVINNDHAMLTNVFIQKSFAFIKNKYTYIKYLIGYIKTNNSSSIRIAEKFGFKRKCLLEEYADGNDVYVYVLKLK